MSDPTEDEQQPTRRPTPAASAASRARRIGGRPAARLTVTDRPAAAEQPAPIGETPSREPATMPEKASEPTVIVQAPAWLRWAPAWALAACAVAMLVILAVTAHGVWYGKPSAQSVRDQVLAAAKTCTAKTNEYNYQTITKDEATGAACTTGAQTARYRSAMNDIVKPRSSQLKAIQTVQINTAGVEAISDSGRQWTVVLFGQTRIAQKSARDRVDPFSAVVLMDRVDGKWLISSIKLITSPTG